MIAYASVKNQRDVDKALEINKLIFKYLQKQKYKLEKLTLAHEQGHKGAIAMYELQLKVLFDVYTAFIYDVEKKYAEEGNPNE